MITDQVIDMVHEIIGDAVAEDDYDLMPQVIIMTDTTHCLLVKDFKQQNPNAVDIQPLVMSIGRLKVLTVKDRGAMNRAAEVALRRGTIAICFYAGGEE